MQEAVFKYVEACRDDFGDARALIEMARQHNVPTLIHSGLTHLLRGVFLETQNRYPPMTDDLAGLANECGADMALEPELLELLSEVTEARRAIANPVYHAKLRELWDLDQCRVMLRRAREIQVKLLSWIEGRAN